MYPHLKSAIAGLVICVFTLGGWFSWNEELRAKKIESPSLSDDQESAYSYYEGWYRFDGILKNTGQFEARTIPDIPQPDEMTRVQARLFSYIKINGVRVYVRYRKSDPFGPKNPPDAVGPWVELCPAQYDTAVKAPESETSSSSFGLRHHTTWHSQVTFEQQLKLPEGPHEFEFRLVPSPNNRWIPDVRVAQGWPIWVGR